MEASSVHSKITNPIHKEDDMLNKFGRTSWIISVIAVVSLILLTACATMERDVHHGIFMKGSILETYDSEVYLCIGKKDGAQVGQELDVIKIISSGNPKSGFMFRREHTGKVRISEIIDEHFAKATIISGKAEKNSIVELNP
jgi:predicted small secreted protein